MARLLNKQSFVPVTLAACDVLLKENNQHRLYYFLAIGARDNCGWLILPQHEVATMFHGWSEEDKATIDEWLAADGFRAYMLPGQRSRFRNPVVDYKDGKLFIRSGKHKVTLLE